MSRNVIIVACWLFATSLAAICPSDWLRFDESCYHLLNESMSWYAANQTCFEMGASLVLPVSPQEQDFIWQIFFQFSRSRHLWIGCNDIQIEGKWQPCPLKNEGNGYESWARRRPNSNDEDVDCAQAHANFNGKWDNAKCYRKLNAMCKFPINITASPTYCLQMGSDGRVAPWCPVSGHVIKELPGTGVVSCGKVCRSEPRCQSFTLREQDRGKTVTRQNMAGADAPTVGGNCLFFDL